MILLDFLASVTVSDIIYGLTLIIAVVLAYGKIQSEISLMKKDVEYLKEEVDKIDQKTDLKLSAMETKIDIILEDITEIKIAIAKLTK